MDDVTIIIVSWNSKALLGDCLRSIEAAGSTCSWSVIVVDNNSADGTVEMLRKDFPKLRLILNAHNAGFAAANNQAMNVAQSRYVMLLNPDTSIHRGALDEIVRFMDDHPTIWAAGPILLNGNGSVQHSGIRFPSAWDILCETFFLDRLFPRSKAFGRHKELYADTSIPRAVDYVRGACLIVRTSVLKTVGGMDEHQC
ncbi:MAG: glycosyl transferase, family 2 [Bacteroidetes bacterium]|nr:glycosyl transferase, family 2 [Bacteroidota bacterium]